MPIYEYQCQACQEPYEARQSISDPPLSKCPACGQEKLERIVSHSSFALKGGGWYADGYGEKKKSGASSSSSSSSTKPSKSEGAAKTDTAEKADKAEKVEAPKPEPKADSGDKKP